MARKSKQTQLCRRISPRDLEIYRLCEVENKTQSLVAKLHQISQPRVCAIVKRRWVKRRPKGWMNCRAKSSCEPSREGIG